LRALIHRLAALLLGSTLGSQALAQDVSEYQLKSALLYNFALFTEWPPESLPDTGTPLNYCVIGEDHFGAALDALGEKQVNNRRIAVRRITRADSAASCHVLFISRSEQGNVERILDAVRGRPVLTVMDQEGMAQRGVMVNLFLDNRRIGFEVNAEAAKRARLNLSSKMLRLARAVY
jgi:hypothetical protein